MIRHFNFRDVAQRVGIPLCNENNWMLGQLLVKKAAEVGIEPLRILADKTDPNPSVNAPHVIAHYPMDWFDTACQIALRVWGDRERQFDMFD